MDQIIQDIIIGIILILLFSHHTISEFLEHRREQMRERTKQITIQAGIYGASEDEDK